MRKRFLVVLGVETFIIFWVVGLISLFIVYPNTLKRLEARLKDEIQARARVIVSSIAEQSVEPILDGDDLVLGLIIARATKNYKEIGWAGITDSEGKVIAHTDLKLVGKKLTLPIGIQPKTVGDFMIGFYDNGNSLWTAYPIKIGEAKRGTVNIGMSVDTGIIQTEARALRRKAMLIYLGLGVLSAFLILLLSYKPIRNLSLSAPKPVQPPEVKPEEEFAERIAEKMREEAAITERIRKMQDEETKLSERIKVLKEKVEPTEKAEPSEEEHVETPPQFVSEKEKIESIRKRIKELEEKMRRE